MTPAGENRGVPISVPANEAERLLALERYRILDTAPELPYDEITELAAQICQCPVAVIGIIDEKRDWLKSKYGLPQDFTEAPRNAVVCATAICGSDLICVPDLTKDPRFKDVAVVTGPPHCRFYCGMPLITPEGYALGTLCVIDFQPREIGFEQQEAMRRLARQAVAQLELRRKLIEQEETLRELGEARAAIETEKAKSDRLLLDILPASIADELKRTARVQPKYYDSVTILFADFAGFTGHAEGLEPAALVQQLDQFFSKFDEIAERHGIEKLKTIGDSYMCVGGLPEPNRTNPADACLAGFEMLDFVARSNRQREKMRLASWELRIGINSGPVVAGVVGKRKFTYDVWGDAVNVAQRMEAAGVPGRINVSENTYHRVKERFETEARGAVEAKNKGRMNMYFVNRLKPEFSADAAGRVAKETPSAQPAPAAGR